MDRGSEIRALLELTPAEVRQRAGERLVVCADLDTLHRRMAADIAGEILANDTVGQPTRLILPVGPTAQYPILAEMIRKQGVSLVNCWFFFMDEYCDREGRALGPNHPLSFRGKAEALFFRNLPPDCGLRREQVFFPDEHNIDELPRRIQALGGIDTCYGGVGIHGHVAFNEPEPGVARLPARRVRLNDFTVTINAIRAEVGGNLENFPREAYTLGLAEILAARRIRLYCRSDAASDWATTVLRLALFGEPGDDYPVTHIRSTDYTLITDERTLASPRYVI